MPPIGLPRFSGVYHISDNQILTLSNALMRNLPAQEDSERVKRQYFADLTDRPADEFSRTMSYTFDPSDPDQGDFLFTGEDVDRLEAITSQIPKLPLIEYLDRLDAFLAEMRERAIDVTHRQAEPKL